MNNLGIVLKTSLDLPRIDRMIRCSFQSQVTRAIGCRHQASAGKFCVNCGG
ncbi:hypothetical protein HanPI659440_Chr16g0637421 [Helianthus annuus]|nr:hypothetical protein HanPI659440_Chr16g0637421 [Helianthus annuus]